MSNFPKPEIRSIGGYTVIDDSRVGTKTRIAHALVEMSESDEIFYPTTPEGASPAALADVCRKVGKNLTLLCTYIQKSNLTPSLRRAESFGANLKICPPAGDFKLVEAWAKAMAKERNGTLIDFDSDAAIHIIAETARSLDISPREVWSASARGAMARAYQQAWPEAEHHAVVVLKLDDANYGTAAPIFTDTPYDTPFAGKTPFRCNKYYEAKAWAEMEKRVKPSENVVFWNPAGPN